MSVSVCGRLKRSLFVSLSNSRAKTAVRTLLAATRALHIADGYGSVRVSAPAAHTSFALLCCGEGGLPLRVWDVPCLTRHCRPRRVWRRVVVAWSESAWKHAAKGGGVWEPAAFCGLLICNAIRQVVLVVVALVLPYSSLVHRAALCSPSTFTCVLVSLLVLFWHILANVFSSASLVEGNWRRLA